MVYEEVMRSFLLLVLLPLALLGNAEEKSQRRILVLSSNGGSGHRAAASSLEALLGEEYEFNVIYPIEMLRIWGISSGEGFYNYMLQNEWIRPMNIISKYLAPKLFRSRKKALEELVASEIERVKPHLVISLIPFVNLPASEAARKKEIPYLLITTDNDLRNWVHGLQGVTHPNFKVTIGADIPSTRDLLKQRKIEDSRIETIGLPLRPGFKMADKTCSELRSEYRIPENKSVVLIMMGGAGSEKAITYTSSLGSLDLNLHFIVIAGKNQKLKKQLKKVKIHPSNSITILGFTDKVSDLMALSDIVITKAGPGTINEAMTVGLPLLLDHTSSMISWERANIGLVTKYGIGSEIKDLDDAPRLLQKYLFDPEVQKSVEEGFSKVPPNIFHERIRDIVNSMCLTSGPLA